MIPKKLHYVWVGGAALPPKYQNFIADWGKKMPDWQIVRWDETNFDIDGSANYCRQAYALGRWAFVSDYIRMKVLYDNGGIYLDTDEEMVQSLDRFVAHNVFFGLESGLRLQAGVFGCEPNNPIVGEILKYYDKIDYVDNTVIGTHILNVLMQLYPTLRLTEVITELEPGVFVYPSNYFCPDLSTLQITENSYTVHRPMGSWLTPKEQFKKNVYIFITKIQPLNWLYCKLKR